MARPAQEAEYYTLINQYLDDGAFRGLVRELADGLGLQVLDVSDHGVVLVPVEDSPFVLKPADFRRNPTVDDRLLDGLAQVAIAATVFPRARDLDENPNLVRQPVTVNEVEQQLRQLADAWETVHHGEPDPAATDEVRGLSEAWRVYRARPDASETTDGRKSARSTRGIIEFALERLREQGCFTQTSLGTELAWQPTRRYQVMVQQLAASTVFQLVRESQQARAALGANG